MYNTFLRYSQNHQNQVYQPQSVLTWHHFLQYLMWLTWLQLFELSHELIQLSLLVDIIVYWTMCLQELIYQGQIHLLKVSALFFFFLCPSLSLSISLSWPPFLFLLFFCCLLFLLITPLFVSSPFYMYSPSNFTYYHTSELKAFLYWLAVYLIRKIGKTNIAL